MFIHTLEAGVRGPKAPSWSSSRAANSWATLDITHYLFYQIARKNRLEGVRIPITVDRVAAELSTLGIDFTPNIWKKRPRVVRSRSLMPKEWKPERPGDTPADHLLVGFIRRGCASVSATVNFRHIRDLSGIARADCFNGRRQLDNLWLVVFHFNHLLSL